MKTISTLLLSVFVFSVSSQKMASFTVVVTDFENTPLKGEQILMIGNKTNKIFKGVTNASGTFDIDIPGGDIYSIKIKSVGEALEYNTMEIPTIGENQFYNKGSLTIMIEQPKLFTLNNVHFDR